MVCLKTGMSEAEARGAYAPQIFRPCYIPETDFSNAYNTIRRNIVLKDLQGVSKSRNDTYFQIKILKEPLLVLEQTIPQEKALILSYLELESLLRQGAVAPSCHILKLSVSKKSIRAFF